MRGALIIRRLRVRGRVGCKPEERAFPQTFTFDLRLTFDPRAAIAHDHVSHAPDYEQVAAIVREQLLQSEWRLLERMLYDVTRALFAVHPAVTTIDVTVEKDILVESATVGATFSMERDELAIEIEDRRDPNGLAR